jgi:hypothetical protein
MSALTKIYCPKCQQGIEGDAEVFGQTVLCPACGHEFSPTQTVATDVSPKASGKEEEVTTETRELAMKWEGRAMICWILGVAAIVITLFAWVVSVVGATTAEPAALHPIGIWIGLSFFSLGFWLYLIAQIIHIRANTER